MTTKNSKAKTPALAVDAGPRGNATFAAQASAWDEARAALSAVGSAAAKAQTALAAAKTDDERLAADQLVELARVETEAAQALIDALTNAPATRAEAEAVVLALETEAGAIGASISDLATEDDKAEALKNYNAKMRALVAARHVLATYPVATATESAVDVSTQIMEINDLLDQSAALAREPRAISVVDALIELQKLDDLLDDAATAFNISIGDEDFTSTFDGIEQALAVIEEAPLLADKPAAIGLVARKILDVRTYLGSLHAEVLSARSVTSDDEADLFHADLPAVAVDHLHIGLDLGRPDLPAAIPSGSSIPQQFLVVKASRDSRFRAGLEFGRDERWVPLEGPESIGKEEYDLIQADPVLTTRFDQRA